MKVFDPLFIYFIQALLVTISIYVYSLSRKE